jgi:hypothetical protein
MRPPPEKADVAHRLLVVPELARRQACGFCPQNDSAIVDPWDLQDVQRVGNQADKHIKRSLDSQCCIAESSDARKTTHSMFVVLRTEIRLQERLNWSYWQRSYSDDQGYPYLKNNIAHACAHHHAVNDCTDNPVLFHSSTLATLICSKSREPPCKHS